MSDVDRSSLMALRELTRPVVDEVVREVLREVCEAI